MLRGTHTLAHMEVSRATFSEIQRLLTDAGYSHAMLLPTDDEPMMLDMSGIAIIEGREVTDSDHILAAAHDAFVKGHKAGRVDPLNAEEAWGHYNPPQDIIDGLHKSGQG